MRFRYEETNNNKSVFRKLCFNSLNFSIENCLFYASFTIPVSHWSLNIIAYINFSMSEPNLRFTVFCFSFGNLLKFMKTTKVDSIEHTLFQNCIFSTIWIWAPFERASKFILWRLDDTILQKMYNSQLSVSQNAK